MDPITIFKTLLAGIAGYLLGSLNSSLIVGKFYGIDVRKHGSGNAGATNTLRTIGKKATAFVVLGDLLKGIVSCLIGRLVVGHVEGIGELGLMTAGLAAVIGHNWPLYFGFRGGKGVLASFSVVLMMDWKIGLILLGIFLVVVAVTRYISLGSITSAVLFPLVSLVPAFGLSLTFTVYAAVLAVLVVYRHRSNISRILKGTESRFGQKST